MRRSGFLVLVAVFLASFALRAQQPNGTLSAQQVMTALAGMRSDISLVLEDNKRLSLRIEELEETLRKKNTQIQDLQTLCNSLTQQNQSLETRFADLQKSVAADQKALRDEFKNLLQELSVIAKNPPAAMGQTEVPKGMELRKFTVEKGDNLSTIAKSAGCTVDQIMAANPQLKSPDELRVGQTIMVPCKKK